MPRMLPPLSELLPDSELVDGDLPPVPDEFLPLQVRSDEAGWGGPNRKRAWRRRRRHVRGGGGGPRRGGEGSPAPGRAARSQSLRQSPTHPAEARISEGR